MDQKIKQLHESGILTKEEMEAELKKLSVTPIQAKSNKKWVLITSVILLIALIVGYFGFFRDYNLDNCQTPQNLSLVVYDKGQIYYITKSEWKKLSIRQKKDVIKIGLVIMVDGEEFMIDSYDYPDGAVSWQEAMRHKDELPNREQAEVIVKHRLVIDEALQFFGLDGLGTHYWTSTLAYESSYNSRAWGFGISRDFLFDDPIECEHFMRFVSPIPQN